MRRVNQKRFYILSAKPKKVPVNMKDNQSHVRLVFTGFTDLKKMFLLSLGLISAPSTYSRKTTNFIILFSVILGC